MRARITLSTAIALIAVQSLARPVLPAIFGDNMVLQQQAKAPIWGEARPSHKVTVTASWGAVSVTVTDDKGHFETRIDTPTAGGPYTVTVSDGQKTVLHDVLIGEVWLCSGQSNMEMPIDGWTYVLNHEQEKADAANHPDIRILQVSNNTSRQPITHMGTNLGGGWQVSSAESISDFSAVAYFFGRQLNKELGVPIGLIDASWGGTFLEPWLSPDGASSHPDLREALDLLAATTETDEERKGYETNAVRPYKPTLTYNAMIHPLVPFAIKGVIWYQGEQNEHKGYQYRELLPLLIGDWRARWGYDFDFYIVQLANYGPLQEQPGDSEWAEVREAQAMTAAHVPGSGMACTIDIGESNDIHPKNKQEVGRRLSLVALAKSYGKHCEYSGPVISDYQISGKEIVVSFDHAEGLHAKSKANPTGFAIAGPDHKFYWAQATIEGSSVRVSSPEVPHPIAVRYGWGQNPPCDLYNRAQLPCQPFRTDDWPGISAGKH